MRRTAPSIINQSINQLFSIFACQLMVIFFNLSVLANSTLNFSGFLVTALCTFLFNGNISLCLGCFSDFMANLKHNSLLLSFNNCKFRISRDFLYPIYFSPKITFRADLCTLYLYCTILVLHACVHHVSACATMLG